MFSWFKADVSAISPPPYSTLLHGKFFPRRDASTKEITPASIGEVAKFLRDLAKTTSQKKFSTHPIPHPKKNPMLQLHIRHQHNRFLQQWSISSKKTIGTRSSYKDSQYYA